MNYIRLNHKFNYTKILNYSNIFEKLPLKVRNSIVKKKMSRFLMLFEDFFISLSNNFIQAFV